MADEYQTKPTLETILERINAVAQTVEGLRAEMEQRFDALDVRLDRIEGVAFETKGNFHTLRADFNELRAALREHFPVVK